MTKMSPQKPFDVLLDDVIDVDIQVWIEERDWEPKQVDLFEEEI